MIVKNLTIFTPSQYRLYIFIRLIQIILSIILIGIVLVVVIFSSISQETDFFKIMAVICSCIILKCGGISNFLITGEYNGTTQTI